MISGNQQVDTMKSDSESPSVEKIVTHPESTFPEGGARAWGVAIGSAGVLFCTFGYANAFGVLQEYYQTHQLRNETPSTISWVGSLQIFFLFAGTLFGGPLFDRFGEKVLWPAAATYVFSVFMTSLCKSYYQFILAQGVLGGISMGMSMAPCMAATGQYFNRKRGAAMGVAIAGSSLGGVVFPVALGKMLNNKSLGFGWSIRICAFLMLVLLVPACVAIRARLPPRKGKLFLPAAFKELQFVSIIGSTFLMMLGIFMPFFYLPTYAVSNGMSTELASYIIAILNGASFFGRVIPGVLADKLGRLNMFCACGLITGILVFCFHLAHSNAPIIVFSALYGFFSGAIISSMSVALAQVPKNPSDLGTYIGMGMSVAGLAVLIGPPIDGALVTRYGGFDQVSIMSGVFVVVGALGVLIAKYAVGNGMLARN